MSSPNPLFDKFVIWFHAVIATFSIAGLFAMLVPFHIGLSAGLASISLVVFTPLAVIGLYRLRSAQARYTRFWWIGVSGVIAAIIGCTVPQVLYLQSASNNDARLSFQPGAYLRFSGATTMAPTKTFVYKTIDTTRLHGALYISVSAPQPQPLVVLLHGGGWRYGNYLQTGEWPRILTRAGFSVISLEYRLATDVTPSWDTAPRDIHDAVVYIHNAAASLGIDNDQIHLMGQSAGGHLALLESYREGGVRSVINLYGPVDVALDYATSVDKSAELRFIGGTPDEFPDRYRKLSPINYVSARTPNTLLVQGTRDDLVSVENAQLLSSKLKKAAVDHRLVLLPLTGHSFENQHGGFATQITQQIVINFLKN